MNPRSAGDPFLPGAIVIVTLCNPREKFWGMLLALAPEGLSLGGIELASFEDLDFVAHKHLSWPHCLDEAHAARRKEAEEGEFNRGTLLLDLLRVLQLRRRTRGILDAVTAYINKRYEELEHEKARKGFVMTVYRRRGLELTIGTKAQSAEATRWIAWDRPEHGQRLRVAGS